MMFAWLVSVRASASQWGRRARLIGESLGGAALFQGEGGEVGDVGEGEGVWRLRGGGGCGWGGVGVGAGADGGGIVWVGWWAGVFRGLGCVCEPDLGCGVFETWGANARGTGSLSLFVSDVGHSGA